MFLKIDPTKTIISLQEGLELLQGEQIQNRCNDILETRKSLYNQLQKQNQGKKVLVEELNSNAEEYLEQKHWIYREYKKIEKEKFISYPPPPIVKKKRIQYEESEEIKEVKEDFSFLKKQILTYFNYNNGQ